MTIEKVLLLESKIKEEIENAKELPDRGIHNPHVIPSYVEGHFNELVYFSRGKLSILESEAAHIDRHLGPLKNFIKDSEARLLSDWNKRERLVKNRAEARSAINTYKEEKRFKLKDLTFAMLFLFEFCMATIFLKTSYCRITLFKTISHL